MKTLLVGLDNPHSRNPRHAMLPMPKAASGHRIVELIREVAPEYSSRQYLRDFGRANLYPGTHATNGKGATKIDRLMARWCYLLACEAGYDNVVLLGGRVGTAFRDLAKGDRSNPAAAWAVPASAILFHPVPHPSRQNRYFNEQEHRSDVGELLYSLRSTK